MLCAGAVRSEVLSWRVFRMHCAVAGIASFLLLKHCLEIECFVFSCWNYRSDRGITLN